MIRSPLRFMTRDDKLPFFLTHLPTCGFYLLRSTQPPQKENTMSKGKKIPMIETAQRRIQSAVDRAPDPTPQQRTFKAKAASVVAKRPSK